MRRLASSSDLGGVLLLARMPETNATGLRPDQAPSFPGISIKVGALGDAAILAGVSPQRGEWEASRKGDIAIRDESLTLETLSSVDVVLFPAERLGDLVNAGVLAPIPNAAVLPPRPPEDETENQDRREPDVAKAALDDTFQYMDIAPAFREDVSKYGPERVALPCGGSALVLVYRRDAFESDPNREAARKAGLSLEQPPATWPQLDALARFFQGRDWNGDGAPDHGIALALGADTEGVGDATFLARAASLGLHRDQYSFLFDADDMSSANRQPSVRRGPARFGCARRRAGPPGMERFDAAAAREAFRTGKVALLIDRAERAATWSHGKPVGVAPLPGSDRVFEPIRKEWMPSSPRNAPSYLPHGGGWLVGINGRLAGTQLEAALDFAKYLANPENTNRLRAERAFPMLPVRTSQMGQGMPDPLSAPDVDSRLWSDAVSRTLLAERVVPGLRIPGADGYLSDLSKGRVGRRRAARPPTRRSPPSPGRGPSGPRPRARSASSGITVAASIPWPRSHNLRNPGNKRVQPWTTPKASPPTLNADIETEVKEMMGLFDRRPSPAAARTSRSPCRRLHERCQQGTRSVARHGPASAPPVVARRHRARGLVDCLHPVDRAPLAARGGRAADVGRIPRSAPPPADHRRRPDRRGAPVQSSLAAVSRTIEPRAGQHRHRPVQSLLRPRKGVRHGFGAARRPPFPARAPAHDVDTPATTIPRCPFPSSASRAGSNAARIFSHSRQHMNRLDIMNAPGYRPGRSCLLALAVISAVAGPAVAARGQTATDRSVERKQANAPTNGLAFEVTYAATLRSEPIKGRVYVFLEPDSSGVEPRSGPDWFRPQPFFAVNVDELEAG